MRWALLVFGLLLVVLSQTAFGLYYDVDLYEMYRATGGGTNPAGDIFLGMNKTFSQIDLRGDCHHSNSDHTCYNAFYFTLWFNGTKTYQTSTGGCVPCHGFTEPLNNTLAEQISYTSFFGSRSTGLQYVEARMVPVKLRGAMERSADPVDLGDVSELTDPAPKSNAFRINSLIPNVLAYFDDDTAASQINSPTAQIAFFDFDLNLPRPKIDLPGQRNDLTLDRDARAMVCADTDNNAKCDINEPGALDCWNKGYDWYKGYCCGVDITTSRYVDKISVSGGAQEVIINAICGKNKQDKWEWVFAGESGQIHEMSWPAGSLVANGSAIFSCGEQMSNITLPFGDFRTIKIRNISHEYSCKDKVVYECGGKTGPFSTNNAVLMGGTNPSFSDEILYCASDGNWTTDLDIKDAESCEAAGFNWTGTYCCSEADDVAESYNDPAYPTASGGCWKKTPIPSGEFAVQDRIINYGGQFFGCNITDSAYLALKDYYNPEQWSGWLVNNSINYCGAVLLNARYGDFPHAVCQPNRLWKFTDEPGGTIFKKIKWEGIAPAGIKIGGCCAYDQCWNGIKCVPLGSYYRVLDEGFVCKLAQPSLPEQEYQETLLPGGCMHDSDCPGNDYDCEKGSCVPRHCSNAQPCPAGYVCRTNQKDCRLVAEGYCAVNADCQSGMVCRATDNRCRSA